MLLPDCEDSDCMSPSLADGYLTASNLIHHTFPFWFTPTALACSFKAGIRCLNSSVWLVSRHRKSSHLDKQLHPPHTHTHTRILPHARMKGVVVFLLICLCSCSWQPNLHSMVPKGDDFSVIYCMQTGMAGGLAQQVSPRLCLERPCQGPASFLKVS